MKTVTDDFLSAQQRTDSVVARTVEYKRRYWDQDTNSYAWESSWTELDPKYISSISPITWQLDTETLTEFKVSNVTLVLDNTDNYFGSDNPTGFFGQDSGSPHYPYEPFWTKFRVRVGYELPDGTDELITLFSGLSDGEFLMDSDAKTAQATINGLESLLLNTNAEDIATFVTLENAGTGDNSETEFLTDNPGVGGISLVALDGLTQTEGSDYSVSDLNDDTLPAKVTFTNPPGIGVVVQISYFYWPQSVEFHELVELLLDEAGIASGDQLVEPVVFENSVINTVEFTSQSDWDGGTLTAIESINVPGSILVDWSDDDHLEESLNTSAGTNISKTTSAWVGGGSNLTSDGAYVYFNGELHENARIDVGSPNININLGSKIACVKFTFKFPATTSGQELFYGYFLDSSFGGAGRGYLIKVRFGASNAELTIERQDSSTFPVNNPISGTYTFAKDTNDHTIKMSRSPAGVFNVFLDGTLALSVTDTTYTTATRHHWIEVVQPGGLNIKFKDFYHQVETISAIWQSDTIDAGSTPDSWGEFSYSETDYGETIFKETRTSDDDMSYDAWVSISGQNIPQSTLRRYAQVRVRFSIDTDSSATGDPIVDSVAFRFITAGINVTLPALTDYSVYSGIQSVGKFALYEFGFTPDEDFFFRPKTTGASVLDLNQSNYISRILGMVRGYSGTYGRVRATYGDITKEITDTGDFSESPKARLRDKVFDHSTDSNLQIPASADIATGVAQGLFKILSQPRRRLKLQTKYLPQLDLSDVVNVTLVNNVGPKLWYLGDPEVDLGSDVNFWGESNQILFEKDCKIVGARYDTERHNCEFDLQEIIS